MRAFLILSVATLAAAATLFPLQASAELKKEGVEKVLAACDKAALESEGACDYKTANDKGDIYGCFLLPYRRQQTMYHFAPPNHAWNGNDLGSARRSSRSRTECTGK